MKTMVKKMNEKRGKDICEEEKNEKLSVCENKKRGRGSEEKGEPKLCEKRGNEEQGL